MSAPARLLLTVLMTSALVGSSGLTALPASTAAESARETAAPSAPRLPTDPGVQAPRAASDGAPGAGRWRVTRTAPDTWQVSWRSPRRLPVTSDRPTITAGTTPVGAPTLRGDGRTVVATVVSEQRPDPATLDVVLSGDRLDHTGVDPADGAAAGTADATADLPRTPVLDADPAEPGAFPVVTSDYELPGVKLPRMREPIEMVGHVVEPAPGAATGPRPLVLFLHGRHTFCYDPADPDAGGFEWPCQPPLQDIPSHLGYDYIQQVLASQGYATVSIRVNGINAQDFRLPDGGADARAQIVQRHLDHWTTLAADHQLDLSRVVLVGHSRGGEGVNRASIQIPLDAPYRVVGQVLLAPTDFGTQTAPYVPTVTVLPYCDGDVFDLQGQRFTDSARDLADDDTSLKSSVLVMGANHNFFNTEWTPGIAQAPSFDDWFTKRGTCGSKSPTRLSAADQRSVGVAYVAGAVRLFADEAQEFLPLFDGTAVHPPSTGAADIRSHAIGGGRELRRPAVDTGLSLAQGADTSFCQGVLSPSSPGACGRGTANLGGNVPHWYDAGEFAPPRRELELAWDQAGESGGMVFDDPLDLSAGRLELRTIVDPTRGDVRLRLRLTDATGATAEVVPEGSGVVQALPVDRFVGKRWAQAVLADPSTASGVDLTRITRVDVVGDSADGRVWVLDLAAAPASLATVPEKRLPTVSLGSVRVEEGDGRGVRTARVPFTIAGEVTEPATLTVAVLRQTARGGRARLRLDLAPGQTEGFLRHEYVVNDVDDFPRLVTDYVAFPVTGAMTDSYLGRVTVLDDDPTPTATVRAPRRVAEGDPIRIRFGFDGERSYEAFVTAEAIRGAGPGRRLVAADVPAGWLARHFIEPEDPDQTLYELGVFLFDSLPPGGRKVELTMPTRADGVAEGVERVTFRLRIDREKVVRTVRVVD